MNITLLPGAYPPEPIGENSPVLALKAMEDQWVRAGGYALAETGVQVTLPAGACALVVTGCPADPEGVLMGSALLSPEDPGPVRVPLHNPSTHAYKVLAGEVIARLVVFNALLAPEVK